MGRLSPGPRWVRRVCTLLAAGAPLAAITSLMLGIGPLGSTDPVSAAAPGVAGLAPLSSVPVPEPSDLTPYIADQTAVVQLGKALFWDMQVGSDGVQACASCHFAAGADARSVRLAEPRDARRRRHRHLYARARPEPGADGRGLPVPQARRPAGPAFDPDRRLDRRRLVAGRLQRAVRRCRARRRDRARQQREGLAVREGWRLDAPRPAPQRAVRDQRRVQRPPVLGRPRAGDVQWREPVRRPRPLRPTCCAPPRPASSRSASAFSARRSPRRPSARPVATSRCRTPAASSATSARRCCR